MKKFHQKFSKRNQLIIDDDIQQIRFQFGKLPNEVIARENAIAFYKADVEKNGKGERDIKEIVKLGRNSIGFKN